MRKLVVLSILAVLQIVGNTQAEIPADTASIHQISDIVVTATRLPTSPGLDSATIRVITREDIELSGVHTVAELLRFVPGVEIRVTGQPGSQTSVFLRGANSGQTLVLRDGIRVNNMFNGAYDFSALSVVNVDRIEIVQGPQSLLYGSEALGGIINIVSRQPPGPSSGLVEVGSGSYDRIEGRGYTAVGSGMGAASLAGSWLETDNARPNSAFRTGELAVRSNWNARPWLTLGVQAGYLESKNGIPNDRFTNDPNDEGKMLNRRLAATLESNLCRWWDVRFSASRARDRLLFDGLEPNPPYLAGDTITETVGRRDLVDLHNVLTIDSNNVLLLGATYEHIDVDHTGSSSFGDVELRSAQDSRAVFGSYRYRSSSGLEVTGGARIDDFSTFGSHATQRVGVRLKATEGISARANLGTGYRAPSLTDLYYPGFGNADLRAEKSRGWDLGVIVADREFEFGAAWFDNRFRDLITFSSTSYKPENIGEARTSGIETHLNWNSNRNVLLRISHTWLPVADNETQNTPLLRRAEHVSSIIVRKELREGRSIDARVLVVGRSEDRDFSIIPAAEVENPGYVKVDIGATT